MKRLIFTTAIIVCAATCLVAGQDLSRYTRPYGFQLPQLETGQYVLSAQGYYYDRDSKSINQDPASYGTENDSKNYLADFSALYAFSSRLLFRAYVEITPSQTVYDYSYYSPAPMEPDSIVRRSYSEEVKTLFHPGATLVYKPQANLEIFVSGGLYKSTLDFVYDQAPNAWDSRRSEETSHSVSFGFTYLGQL